MRPVHWVGTCDYPMNHVWQITSWWLPSRLALLCVVALLAQAGRQSFAAGSGTSTETAPRQFASSTAAERELEKILSRRGGDIDLALVNWLIAADIPEFQDLSRDAYFKQLDAMTEQVRQEMARMRRVAASRGDNVDSAKTRCGIFCNAIIKLGFAYTEEFRQENVTPAMMKTLYANPDNICLAGMLRTQRGSCVSMPLIYLVIGQRFGLPVHLVAVGKHYFIRWEEPGYRMNIEPTIVNRVAVTPDDSVYLETEGLTGEHLKGSDLRNLSRREVVGQLLFARSAYWATKGPEFVAAQHRDLAQAHVLAPDDAAILRSHEAVFRADRENTGQSPTANPPQETKGD